jgi:hypothetical protein
MFKNIQYVYLLTKYIKWNVCRLAVRYVIYIYIYIYIYDVSRLRVNIPGYPLIQLVKLGVKRPRCDVDHSPSSQAHPNNNNNNFTLSSFACSYLPIDSRL